MGFGDKSADGKTIKLSQSDKWFRQAGVIQPRGISTTDTGIAFRKIAKNQTKINFQDWNKYLNEIGESTQVQVDSIKSKLSNCGKTGMSLATSTRGRTPRL